jgi:hypothetical protein
VLKNEIAELQRTHRCVCPYTDLNASDRVDRPVRQQQRSA